MVINRHPRHRTPRQIKSLRRLPLLFLALLTTSLCLLIPSLTLATSATHPNPTHLAAPTQFLASTLALRLTEAAQPSPTTTTAESQEQQAQQLYESGQFSAAIALLQQTLQTYQQQGDRKGQAIVLSNLALNYQKIGKLDSATQSIDQALSLLQDPKLGIDAIALQAQALDIQGSLQLTSGQAEAAAATWQQSAALYTQTGDEQRAASSTINQAQAFQTIGLYARAINTLQTLEKNLDNQPDSLAKVSLLRNLGDAIRVTGNPDDSEKVLQKSLAIAQSLKSPEAIAATQLSLGNTQLTRARTELTLDLAVRAREAAQAALKSYQQAAQSPIVLTRIQASLNQLYLLTESSSKLFIKPDKTVLIDQWKEAATFYPQVQQLISSLPPGQPAVAAQISLGQRLMTLRKHSEKLAPNLEEIAQIFATAAQQANALNNYHAHSEALGLLGTVYQKAEQWKDAQSLTEKALTLAQGINAPELSYRWQWQLGQVLCRDIHACAKTGNVPGAIAAYQEAFNTLQSLRRDLTKMNADVQFSFRESVEPIYREFVDLLLQPIQTTASASIENKELETARAVNQKESLQAQEQTQLQQARQVLEALQVADLENFLQSACQDTQLKLDQLVDNSDRTSSVIYPIILGDRLEVILKLPGQSDLYRYPPIRLANKEVTNVLNELQVALQDESNYAGVKTNASKVYDWLVKPAEDKLKTSNIKNLIFVLDGPFRLIPMGVLYDGQQYLVEKYATSLAMGLQVREPQPLVRQNMKVLAATLTEPPKEFAQFYSNLEFVNPEVDKIKADGISVKFLRDQAFTKAQFNQAINSDAFQVIHLATHGQFGATRESTYLLTADGPIYIDNLSEVFRRQGKVRSRPIELLILSACRTATGSDRAVLGIAGTAVRAGARSTIAGLWSLADAPSVSFAEEFYKHLGTPDVSRSEALRRAQLALLKSDGNNGRDFSHPRFWAPYVLVGSWL